MKLRTWLFLALFFSSFSVFADTEDQAYAKCNWFIKDYPNSGYSCSKVGSDKICVSGAGGPNLNYCWGFTPPACDSTVIPSNSISVCPTVCAPGYAATIVNGETGQVCFAAGPENCAAAGMIQWTNQANGAEYCVYACDSPKVRGSAMPPPCVNPPAKCDYPLMNDPADPSKCIPYPDCPSGQARNPQTKQCEDCRPPEVYNSLSKTCELPNCPPPGAWNYSTHKCEGGPPPVECNAPKIRDQYGNCIDPSNPSPTPPPGSPGGPSAPPGTPGHDGNGSGTSTSSTGETFKFDFKIDLSGLEKNTAESAASAKQAEQDLSGIKGELGEIKNSLKPPSHDLAGLNVPGKDFSGRTYTELLNNFTTKLQSAPLVNSVNQFFNISAPGGSCPVWSVNAWVFDIVIDAQCSQSMQNVWPIIHGVMILIFSVLAFRTAFL